MSRRLFTLLTVLLFWSSVVCQAQAKPLVSKWSLALVQRVFFSLPGDSVDVMLVTTNGQLQNSSFKQLQVYKNTIVLRGAIKDLKALLQDAAVVFADLVKRPKEELTTGALDPSANGLSIAHRRFPTVTGAGILASIKEQQFDTTDIDYEHRYINTAAAASSASSHAAIMATTLAGGGNSSLFARGAAPGASVTSTSFASLLPESDAYYQHFQITIQNHSYGTVPENYYGAEAAAYDQSVVSNSTLVHVFSAGNSGTAAGAGPYNALQGWANLTGNFKTAKNVIVVGATDSFYHVAAASSKGPAFDGRVKPELVAFGEDGSSGAAALTSGAVALVQQAYKAIVQTVPPAALVKAVLLNSADDVEALGLDYASGYGRLNGYKAVQTVLEKRFLQDSVAHGDLKKFALTVPPHTAQLKVTLAWTDVPAMVNATTALVNDLDLTLQTPAKNEVLPWVLHPGLNVDSLTKPAIRQKDTLNNVEQITLDAPTAGTYTLLVKGERIATSNQTFAIAYEIDTADAFTWTFPNANDPVLAGAPNVLRWQTTFSGEGIIEYTTDHKTWHNAATVFLNQSYYKWIAPDTISTAQVRMRINNVPFVSDTFVLSRNMNVGVGFACPDSFLLFWKAMPVAQYRIYNYNNGALQPVATTPDTSIIFKTAQHSSLYYSIAPVVNGDEGLRSFTFDYTVQGAACYFRSFYVSAQDEQQVTFAAQIGTTYNLASIALQKLKGNNFVTLQTIVSPTTTDFSFSDTTLHDGGNRYRLQLVLRTGAVIYSDEISVFQVANSLIFVYPNPVRSGQPITIRTSNGEPVRLRIFNAAGALVQQTNLNLISTSVKTIALPAGIYFMEAVNEKGTRRTHKLVVY